MRRRTSSTALLAGCVVVAIAIVGAVFWAMTGRSSTASTASDASVARAGADAAAPAPPPPPTGAYATGGVPQRDSAVLDHAFTESFPTYAVALDTWAKQLRSGAEDTTEKVALAAARDGVLTKDVREALGHRGASRLGEVLDRARDAAGVFDAETDDAAEALIRAVIEFNDEMAARDLAYAVDSDVLIYDGGQRRIVLLFSFAVERVRLYESDGNVVRVLHLTRLDNLNWSYSLLGFTSPQRREALLLRHQIEERMIDRILPLIAPKPMPYFDVEDAELDAQWYRRVSRRVVDIARAEYEADTGKADAIKRLAALVGRRKQIYRAWNEELDRYGIVVTEPETLVVEFDMQSELEGYVGDDELREVKNIEALLATPEMADAFRHASSVLVESIERHEVQHRLDNSGTYPMPLPKALEDWVGPLYDDEGRVRTSASRAQAELSAYLSELAREPIMPKLVLSQMAQFLIDARQWGTAECYASIVAFEQLAADLDLPKSTIVVDREIQRSLVADIYVALTDLGPTELRVAARALWERLFETSLPPMIAKAD